MNSKNTSTRYEDRKTQSRNLLLAAGCFILLVILIWFISHTLNLYSTSHLEEYNIIYLNAQIVLSVSSSILLVILLSQYLENFRKFETQFTMGFVILAVVLIAHSITSNPLFFSYFGYPPMEGPFSIIPLIFTLTATLALLYLNYQ